MKDALSLLILGFSIFALLSACGGGNGGSPPVSTHEWTWVSGNKTINQAGIYGTKDTPDPSNFPGARASSASWIDAQGKLWLFGGFGLDSPGNGGFLNDLWKYDPTTLEWTWVSGSNTANQSGVYGTKGTADSSNAPGGRYAAVSWIDSQGKLWLFGGYGLDWAGTIDVLNDLWKYDPATLEWTWISGSHAADQSGIYGTKGTAAPSNIPGARQAAVSWIDSQGNLWLFGGAGFDSAGNQAWLNDLWKYNPATYEWTWASGSDTRDQAGIYGTKGTAAPSNVPGARESAVSGLDSSGKLWVFGGYGYDPAGNRGWLNDLWQYDPTTPEWTWVSGSNTLDQPGTYGAQGISDSLNVPGARQTAVSWLDSRGRLWLFGGYGYDPAGNQGHLNDLWQYNPTSREWTWVSGANFINQPGLYGTKGTASRSNVPGARQKAAAWINSSGKLWLFGGYGYASAGNQGYLNDLWH